MRYRVLILVAGCVPLAGCGFSMFDNGPKFAVRPVDSGIVDAQSEGSVALAEAREKMRGGNLMAAMSAFRIAQRDPNTAAEATNGLGVAWAKLGRHDIAERMFIEAVAMAPQDRRYVANLERLYADRAMAGSVAEAQFATMTQSQVQSLPVNGLKSGTVSASGSNDQLVRVSNREVVIGASSAARSVPTPQPSTAPARVSAVPAPAAQAQANYPIRVALPRMGDRSYPVRVSSAGNSSAITVLRRSTASYPIRIASNKPASAGYPLRVQLRRNDAAAD